MLHFFGCSVTWGAELSDRHAQSYPALLSKALNQPYHNYARCGNDDFTSINTFFRLFKNGYIKRDDTVFFQWSGVRRHGIPFGKTVIQYPWIETELGKWKERSKEEQDAVKAYVQFINDQPLVDLNRNMRWMFTSWAQSQGARKFILFKADEGHYSPWNSYASWLPESFLGYTDKLNIPRAKEGHPTEHGHAMWAQYLLEFC